MKALFDFCRADAGAACLMLMSSHQNDKDEPFRGGKKNVVSRDKTHARGCDGETAVNDDDDDDVCFGWMSNVMADHWRQTEPWNFTGQRHSILQVTTGCATIT